MVKLHNIVNYLNDYLNIANIPDKSQNGLQLKGGDEINRIALVVDAALAVYPKAKAQTCELVLAHHGLIWGGGLKSITGRNHEHISYLLNNDISLYAAHLPLDAHLEVGNNAELARILGLCEISPFGAYNGIDIGLGGKLTKEATIDEIAQVFCNTLGCKPRLLSFGKKSNSKVAIVSGGGGSALEEAIDKEYDCYITGEGSHGNYHMAREGGINVIYLGHYYSETVGVKALGGKLTDEFGVPCVFLDEPTGF